MQTIPTGPQMFVDYLQTLSLYKGSVLLLDPLILYQNNYVLQEVVVYIAIRMVRKRQ